MGCGCSKGGNRNTRRSNGVAPSSGNRGAVVQNNQTISQQSISPKNENKNVTSVDRRNIEKIRREAIRRALGR
jgi:hypothetical protein